MVLTEFKEHTVLQVRYKTDIPERAADDALTTDSPTYSGCEYHCLVDSLGCSTLHFFHSYSLFSSLLPFFFHLSLLSLPLCFFFVFVFFLFVFFHLKKNFKLFFEREIEANRNYLFADWFPKCPRTWNSVQFFQTCGRDPKTMIITQFLTELTITGIWNLQQWDSDPGTLIWNWYQAYIIGFLLLIYLFAYLINTFNSILFMFS